MRWLSSKPTSEKQLFDQAQSLAGITLGQLANQLNEKIPASLHHAKGWVGQLLEKALGASAGNLDLPDFPDLKIEMKSLPINEEGLPQESTYICRVSLPFCETNFYQSRVWRKCARILWVPVQAEQSCPIAMRTIGQALLWSPSSEVETILKQDWEELTAMIRLGHFHTLSAQHGTYLQLRPKAANGRESAQVINEQGHTVSIVPQGFYLRPSFTQTLIKTHYA